MPNAFFLDVHWKFFTLGVYHKETTKIKRNKKNKQNNARCLKFFCYLYTMLNTIDKANHVTAEVHKQLSLRQANL